jgi:hypothetical protein
MKPFSAVGQLVERVFEIDAFQIQFVVEENGRIVL